MVNDNRPIDVYIGEEFLKLAVVPGGFYYSSEQKKTDFSKVSEILDAPRFVYVIMDGNATFPSALFSAFFQKHHLAFSPVFELIVNDFERVCQPEKIIDKYHLADLMYEDKGHGSLKTGDLLVSIELKRINEAGYIMDLFKGIRNALSGLSLENMPYTLTSRP